MDQTEKMCRKAFAWWDSPVLVRFKSFPSHFKWVQHNIPGKMNNRINYAHQSWTNKLVGLSVSLRRLQSLPLLVFTLQTGESMVGPLDCEMTIICISSLVLFTSLCSINCLRYICIHVSLSWHIQIAITASPSTLVVLVLEPSIWASVYTQRYVDIC